MKPYTEFSFFYVKLKSCWLLFHQSDTPTPTVGESRGYQRNAEIPKDLTLKNLTPQPHKLNCR